MLYRHSRCIENSFAPELRQRVFARFRKRAPLKSAGGPNFLQTVGACVSMIITEIIQADSRAPELPLLFPDEVEIDRGKQKLPKI
jgi:hypothetical protein